jgi:hypothetical protein
MSRLKRIISSDISLVLLAGGIVLGLLTPSTFEIGRMLSPVCLILFVIGLIVRGRSNVTGSEVKAGNTKSQNGWLVLTFLFGIMAGISCIMTLLGFFFTGGDVAEGGVSVWQELFSGFISVALILVFIVCKSRLRTSDARVQGNNNG